MVAALTLRRERLEEATQLGGHRGSGRRSAGPGRRVGDPGLRPGVPPSEAAEGEPAGLGVPPRESARYLRCGAPPATAEAAAAASARCRASSGDSPASTIAAAAHVACGEESHPPAEPFPLRVPERARGASCGAPAATAGSPEHASAQSSGLRTAAGCAAPRARRPDHRRSPAVAAAATAAAASAPSPTSSATARARAAAAAARRPSRPRSRSPSPPLLPPPRVSLPSFCRDWASARRASTSAHAAPTAARSAEGPAAPSSWPRAAAAAAEASSSCVALFPSAAAAD